MAIEDMSEEQRKLAAERLENLICIHKATHDEFDIFDLIDAYVDGDHMSD